jgi:hypothetical protein
MSSGLAVQNETKPRNERSLRLQAGCFDDPFGQLAFVSNEAGEFLQTHSRWLDGAIDEHALPEVAVIYDARNLASEFRDDEPRRAGRREQAKPSC